MAKHKGTQKYNGKDLIFGELRMGFIRENKDLVTISLQSSKTLDELASMAPLVHQSLRHGMGDKAPAYGFLDELTPDEMTMAVRDMLQAIGYIFKPVYGQETQAPGESSQV